MPVTQRVPTLMPRPRVSAPREKLLARVIRAGIPFVVVFLVFSAGLFSLPSILAQDLAYSDSLETVQAFPVTVDPQSKTITENAHVEYLLSSRPLGIGAASGMLDEVFRWVAVEVSHLSVYQVLAGAGGFENLFVTIRPGYRMEQVASEFGNTLGWTSKQRQQFLALQKAAHPDLPEGSVVPGIYFVGGTSPADVATVLNTRFEKNILSRYGTSTAEQVPVKDALTIASLLDREAGSWDDMRLISGVIWNRLFSGMRLQIDATLQYAEANQTKGAGGWWPSVEPKDKYIKSAYNTYLHEGLPPAPIANPSLAAVLASLNPKKTDCLFYFHDSQGQFHCTKSYGEHVAMLKKYYGQGK